MTGLRSLDSDSNCVGGGGWGPKGKEKGREEVALRMKVQEAS